MTEVSFILGTHGCNEHDGLVDVLVRFRGGAADRVDSRMRGSVPGLRDRDVGAVVLGDNRGVSRNGPLGREQRPLPNRHGPTGCRLAGQHVGSSELGQLADRARVSFGMPVVGAAPPIGGRCVVLE